MDWDKLRIFHAVADAGSLTHAGDTLHLSQSAVSRQIRALEESLGVTLFHRHARGLILTEQGELLFTPRPDGALDLQFAGRRTRATVYVQGEEFHVFTPQGATRIGAVDPLAHAGVVAGEGGRLTAPMPGKVVSFAVQPGDQVSKGQPLAVMEAMKMEHTIAAPQDGVVAELLYAPGDQVAEGAELLKLSAA